MPEVDPVSYTHLDVYKRQVLTTLIFNFDGKSDKLERLILQNNETIH